MPDPEGCPVDPEAFAARNTAERPLLDDTQRQEIAWIQYRQAAVANAIAYVLRGIPLAPQSGKLAKLEGEPFLREVLERVHAKPTVLLTDVSPLGKRLEDLPRTISEAAAAFDAISHRRRFDFGEPIG